MRGASVNRTVSTIGSIALAAAACTNQPFRYTLIRPEPVVGVESQFREAVRDRFRLRFAKDHFEQVEVPNLASLNVDVRHCLDEAGTRGCKKLGNKSAVIIFPATTISADSVIARVQTFVDELRSPDLAFTIRTVVGTRSQDGRWELHDSGQVVTGSM